jgi:hypothetical protein
LPAGDDPVLVIGQVAVRVRHSGPASRQFMRFTGNSDH